MNNTRGNLRKCAHWQNCHNRPSYDNPTGFKGVFRNGKSGWMARIMVRGRLRYLGTFNTTTEAALAYNRAAMALVGKFARVNSGAARLLMARILPPPARRRAGAAPKGIIRCRGKFRARIWVRGRLLHLGRFKTLRGAMDAYNKAALEEFGAGAVLSEDLTACHVPQTDSTVP